MINKRNIIIALALLTVVGSLFTVLASNMFFGDIINMSAGFENATLFATLPAIGVAVTFAVAILFILRGYKHPDCLRRLARLYSIFVIALNGLGLLGDILSVAVVYHSFVAPNPFPGYLIIFTILNLALLCGGVFGLLSVKRLQEDTGRIKINFLYVLKTIGWFLFIMMVLNRLGTLLGAPAYIYLRNLGKTFLFYVYLLVPLYLGVVECLFILKVLDRKTLSIMAIVGLGLNVALFAYIAIMGMSDSGFVSSLSQAMPLERMASKPLEILIHVLSYSGVGAAILVQNRKGKAE